jgi:Na+-transporting methylmalonyl-CoA/oxaloacetate decarboxylase gamma subunit
MSVDWGRAFQIGGVGFGTVFLVLGILAAAIVLIAIAARRIGRSKSKDSIQEGD